MKEACCFFFIVTWESHGDERKKTHILKQQSSNIHASAPGTSSGTTNNIRGERKNTNNTTKSWGHFSGGSHDSGVFDGVWRMKMTTRQRRKHTHTNPLTHDDDLVYECIMNDDRCWWWWWMHTHNNRSRTNNNSRDKIIFLCARKFQVTDYTRVVWCVLSIRRMPWRNLCLERTGWIVGIAIRAGLLRGLRDLRAHGNNVERELRFENGFT